MKETLSIEGMTCDHCVMHVTKALESVSGVEKAKVSLKKNNAVVKFTEPADLEAMSLAVAEAGYKVI